MCAADTSLAPPLGPTIHQGPRLWRNGQVATRRVPQCCRSMPAMQQRLVAKSHHNVQPGHLSKSSLQTDFSQQEPQQPCNSLALSTLLQAHTKPSPLPRLAQDHEGKRTRILKIQWESNNCPAPCVLSPPLGCGSATRPARPCLPLRQARLVAAWWPQAGRP